MSRETLVEYAAAFPGGPWRWIDGGTCLTWTDGTTIAFWPASLTTGALGSPSDRVPPRIRPVR